MITLPKDLTEFLAAKRQLEYSATDCECGQVILLPLGQHELGEVWVDGDSVNDIAVDPNKGIEGYYAVPAVNLVKSCQGYDPEHILSWIPQGNRMLDAGKMFDKSLDHRVIPGTSFTFAPNVIFDGSVPLQNAQCKTSKNG